MNNIAKVVRPTEGDQEEESAEQQSIGHLINKQESNATQCHSRRMYCTTELSLGGYA